MEIWSPKYVMLLTMAILWSLRGTLGIRFVIDKEECFGHNVEYARGTLHASFVVIKDESPRHLGNNAVDVVIKGPSGEEIHNFRDKTSEKYEFKVHEKGIYRFCFANRSPFHETIDFDVRVSHFSFYHQLAKDEHIDPLLEQIEKFQEALYIIQFEQHWLSAQTYSQAIVNDRMSRRAIHKAMFESAALVGASFLQVYLLQALFERKLGTSMV